MWGTMILGGGSAATGALLATSGVLAAGGSSAVPASNLRPALGLLETWFLWKLGSLVLWTKKPSLAERIAMRWRAFIFR